MTRIYDRITKELVIEQTLHIAGFTIKEGDVLNISGKKYKVSNLEYVLTTNRNYINLEERKIYVEECM